MFANKWRVDLVMDGERQPCPMDWLDKFFMRNFTGAAEFDDTLPTGDGRIETGLRVQPERLATALEAWLVKTGKAKGRSLHVEINPVDSKLAEMNQTTGPGEC
jgi:hypothetical protein